MPNSNFGESFCCICKWRQFFNLNQCLVVLFLTLTMQIRVTLIWAGFLTQSVLILWFFYQLLNVKKWFLTQNDHFRETVPPRSAYVKIWSIWFLRLTKQNDVLWIWGGFSIKSVLIFWHFYQVFNVKKWILTPNHHFSRTVPGGSANVWKRSILA